MARDRDKDQVDAKDAPPNGYARPKGHKGPHRSDPDFGYSTNMSNPTKVKKEGA
jgi:hypothetical protein